MRTASSSQGPRLPDLFALASIAAIIEVLGAGRRF